jgi:hypothetical protein
VTRAGVTPLLPGIYRSIQAAGSSTLHFAAGIYVITGTMQISGNATANVGGATLYFACSSYPQPCASGSRGAGLSISGTVNFAAGRTVDLTSPYNGLSIFYDRDNAQDLVLGGGALSVTGSIYAPSARLALSGNSGPALLTSMAVVDSFEVSGSTGRSFRLAYDPALNVSLRTSGGGLVR